MQNLRDDYCDRVKTSTETIKSALLLQYAEIEKEEKEFDTNYAALKKKAQDKSVEYHEQYRKLFKNLIAQVRNKSLHFTLKYNYD